jgi:hypothetical protein
MVTTDNAIWIDLPLRRMVVAGVYIPPADSQYYNDELFADIQARIQSSFADRHVIIGGDMNARMGDYSSLPLHGTQGAHYLPSDDRSRNSSGVILESF